MQSWHGSTHKNEHCMIYDIVFLAIRKTMVKPVAYHVEADDNEKAVEIAIATLKTEHNINYYDCGKIVVKQTRVLR